MKTIEIMSAEPRSVNAIDRLDVAARALWEGDCGLVPVVDAGGVVLGVITDRDLCMATYTQGRTLSEVPISAVMAREVVTCRAEDSVADVMKTMRQAQVHRLPVVDPHGVLVGIISTNDLVRAAHARPAAVDLVTLVRTLATIGAPRDAALRAADPARPAPEAAKAPRGRSGAARKSTPKKVAKKSSAKKSPAKKAAARAAAARGRKKA